MMSRIRTILHKLYKAAHLAVMLPLYVTAVIFLFVKFLHGALPPLFHVLRISISWTVQLAYSHVRLRFMGKPRFMLCESCWRSTYMHRCPLATDPVLIEVMQMPAAMLFTLPIVLLLSTDEADGTALVDSAACELCHVNELAREAMKSAVIISEEPDIAAPTLEVVTRPGQDLTRLGLRPAMHVSEHSNSQQCFDKVRGWIEECSAKHALCRESHSSNKKSNGGPRRLIDTGPLDGDVNLRLIERPQYRSEVVRYCALSYCWGSDTTLHFTTTAETYDERLKGISSEQLPQTLRDAVKITREAGCRYLWIDALCITQHDAADWEAESCRMHLIYGNAYLVIAATENSSPGNSIFGRRSPVGQFEAQLSRKTYRLHAMEKMDHSPWRHHYRIVDTEPVPRQPTLHTRAWAYQERLLATRIIHYTAAELVWECNTGCQCECGELQRPALGSQYGKGLSLKSQFTRNMGTNEAWKFVIENYAVRGITVPSDKLIALAGLARRFHSPQTGKYLAGIWFSQLPDALTWVTLESSTKPDRYRAPSWSWASMDGEVMGIGTASRTSGVDCAEILEAECTPAGEDPFGAVSDGYIILRGKFAPLDSSDDETWALRIKSFGWSLILKRSARVEGAWERIDGESVGDDVFLGREDSIVKIV